MEEIPVNSRKKNNVTGRKFLVNEEYVLNRKDSSHYKKTFCCNEDIFSAERKFLMGNVSEIKLGLSSWTKYTHNLTPLKAKMEL